MKHAGPDALEALNGVIFRLRELVELKERKPGVFYRNSRAFLHFHEDPAGLFCDVRLDTAGAFTRVPVNTPDEQERVLARVHRSVSRDVNNSR